MKTIHTILAASLLALASLPVAHAAIVESYGSAACQASLDGSHLRAQPVQIKNFNEVTTFVTCSVPIATQTAGTMIFLRNDSAVDVTVGCTLVASPFNVGYGVAPSYYPASIKLAPGERNFIYFNAATLGVVGGAFPSVTAYSCGLPPLVGVEQLRLYQN